MKAIRPAKIDRIDIDEDGVMIPTFMCVRVTHTASNGEELGANLVFVCPLCGELHSHGTGNGHRAKHCIPRRTTHGALGLKGYNLEEIRFSEADLYNTFEVISNEAGDIPKRLMNKVRRYEIKKWRDARKRQREEDRKRYGGK